MAHQAQTQSHKSTYLHFCTYACVCMSVSMCCPCMSMHGSYDGQPFNLMPLQQLLQPSAPLSPWGPLRLPSPHSSRGSTHPRAWIWPRGLVLPYSEPDNATGHLLLKTFLLLHMLLLLSLVLLLMLLPTFRVGAKAAAADVAALLKIVLPVLL